MLKEMSLIVVALAGMTAAPAVADDASAYSRTGRYSVSRWTGAIVLPLADPSRPTIPPNQCSPTHSGPACGVATVSCDKINKGIFPPSWAKDPAIVQRVTSCCSGPPPGSAGMCH